MKTSEIIEERSFRDRKDTVVDVINPALISALRYNTGLLSATETVTTTIWKITWNKNIHWN